MVIFVYLNNDNRQKAIKKMLKNQSLYVNFFINCRNFGQSQSAANANAYNQQFGPNGFGASAANAGAQGFQSQGALGEEFNL